MKRISILAAAVLTLSLLGGCGSTSDTGSAETTDTVSVEAENDTAEDAVTDDEDSTVDDEAAMEEDSEEAEDENETQGYAEYDGCSLQLGDADISDGYIVVHATYTNDNEDPLYSLCSFAVKAFQNDTEIEDISDINGDDADLITEVKDGQSIDVTYRFELVDDSEVEVMVCTPTADQDIITTMIY